MSKLTKIFRVLAGVVGVYIVLAVFLQISGSFWRAVSSQKTTPLALAATAGDVDKIKSLVSSGIAVDERNGKGDTPLMLAVKGGKTEAVDALLIAGADPNALDKVGSSVASLAVDYGNPGILAILLDRGAAIDSKDFLGDSLIFMAAYKGKTGIVNLLFDRGAKTEGTGYHGTILQYAVYGKSAEIIRILTGRGADVNAADKWGFTPLMTAAREGDAAVAGELIALGARSGAKNLDGKTACDIAVAYKHEDIAEFLCVR